MVAVKIPHEGGSGFLGFGYLGFGILGVGAVGGVGGDTVLDTDTSALAVAWRPSATDSVVDTDAAMLVAATHGEQYGPGTGFLGIGMTGYAFLGVGTSNTFPTLIVTDASNNTDLAAISFIAVRSTLTADTALDSESVGYATHFARSAVDASTIVDSANRTFDWLRPVVDQALDADSPAASFIASRSATDSCTDSDTASNASQLARSASDSVLDDDASSIQVILLRLATDTVLDADHALAFLARASLDFCLCQDAPARAVTVHIPGAGILITSMTPATRLTMTIETATNEEDEPMPQLPGVVVEGSVQLCRASFVSELLGVKVDPDAVKIGWSIYGIPVEAVYLDNGAHGTIVRDDLGDYHFMLPTAGLLTNRPAPALVTVEWEGTGAAAIVDWDVFQLVPAPISL